MTEDLFRRAYEWKMGPNVGLSSDAMLNALLGVERNDGWGNKDHPWDPSDFNRCLLVVEQFPEIKDVFSEIASLTPQWRAIIHHWDQLREMFISEAGWNWSKSDSAPKTYHRMKELLKLSRNEN